MPVPRQSLGTRFLAIAMPFFRSGRRRQALVALGLLIGLLLGINGLNVVNSFVGRDMTTALTERHAAAFWLMMGLLVLVFAGSTVVQVFSSYLQDWIGILWREWLTQCLLDRYLANRTYHRLASRDDIDNPDQRIAEDVRTFTTTTLSFLVLVTNAVLTMLAFSGVLWSITPLLFFTAVGYSAFGSLGTILLGRRLVTLDNLQLQKEANFRYALGRVREHAPSIAQLKGEVEERSRLGTRLDAVVHNFRSVIVVTRNLGFFVTGYNYLPQVIPAAVVAHLYLSGQIEFGTVTQSAMAFSQLLGAFSLVITQFQQVSAYTAVINRLGSLWEATESEAHPSPVPADPEPVPAPALPVAHSQVALAPAPAPINGEPRVRFHNLTLHTPGDHRLLIHNLSLELTSGKRILVTGPNGAGKTALVLATAGLWSISEGEVAFPSSQDVMFLPQRPYLPPGRLRDVVLYALDQKTIPDERLMSVLEQVGLDDLVHQVGLDAEGDWEKNLSASEQQAITFARVLLAQPRFAFFDSTSRDLDDAHVDCFFGLLAASPISYLSVGDQPALRHYHDLELELLGEGRWRLAPIDLPVGRTAFAWRNGHS